MTAAPAAADAGSAAKAPLPPKAVLSYQLTTADALEWERRDPAIRRRNRAGLAGALLAGLGLLSLVTRHLPAWLSALHSNAIALAILCLPLGVVLVLQRIDLAQRARRRVPAPVDVRLSVWDRRLVEERADRDAPLVVGAQAVRAMIDTADHIFLHAKAGTVIVPGRAFPTPRARDDFAGHWEALTT